MDNEEMVDMMQKAGIDPSSLGQNQPEKLDHISLFLQHVDPDELEEIILDKTRSIGIIKEEHMPGYNRVDQAILTLASHGQLRSALKLARLTEAELRRTMSIEGHFIDNISKQELRYTTTQHLYPHEDNQQPKRKGFFGRGK